MRERKSLGMKNFIFKSQNNFDFTKIFNQIQAEQRHARFDLQEINKKCDTCVKALALLVSAPEPDLEDMTDNTIPELEDK